MKIIHLSDTHLKGFDPEPGDILIHSGDALNAGSFMELVSFRQELEKVKNRYKHIIYVPGNHDFIFEDDPKLAIGFIKETIPNLHVLINEELVIDGIKFYGTPDQPVFFHWAFNKEPEDLIKSYNNIPKDVNVLITHCPPHGILDYVVNRYHPGGVNVGSTELLNALPELKALKLCCFGHIHYSYGTKLIDGIMYSNGALVDERYIRVNKEIVLEEI